MGEEEGGGVFVAGVDGLVQGGAVCPVWGVDGHAVVQGEGHERGVAAAGGPVEGGGAMFVGEGEFVEERREEEGEVAGGAGEGAEVVRLVEVVGDNEEELVGEGKERGGGICGISTTPPSD